MFKLIKRLLLLAIVLLAIGLGYARHRDREASEAFWADPPAPAGEMVAWGGGDLHLYCTGSGAPLVMLVSGLGDPYRSWGSIHSRLPISNRVCAYDRSGLGYAPPSDEARTPTRAANELMAAVQAAAPAGTPVILVGHSLGGLYARHFAHMYPRDVAGLVLVDPSHEEQMERLPLPPLLMTIGQSIPSLLRTWGIARVQFDRQARDGEGPSADLLAEFYASGRSGAAASAEFRGIRTSGSEVRTVPGILGNRPLVVLSAGKAALPPGVDAEAVQAAWFALHEEIAAESNRGRRMVVPTATHYIHMDEPDAVVAEILLMVETVSRQTAGR